MSKLSTFGSRIKNIQIPVFKLIFYSSLGYLGYVFYQDYEYQQLIQEIKQNSEKNHSNPLKKASQINKAISQSQSKRQLRFLLRDLQLIAQQYFVDPYKINNLIDFDIKELEKSEDEKKMWWLQSYITRAKLYANIYHRIDVFKEGYFGIFFWSKYKVQQKNQVLECSTINSLIHKALEMRKTKCRQFSISQQTHGITSPDEQIAECLNQSLKEASSLEKIMQRIKVIENMQNRN